MCVRPLCMRARLGYLCAERPVGAFIVSRLCARCAPAAAAACPPQLAAARVAVARDARVALDCEAVLR